MPTLKFELNENQLSFYFPKKNWDPIAGKDVKISKEAFDYFENKFSNFSIDYANPGPDINFIFEVHLLFKQIKPLKRYFSQQIVFNKKHLLPSISFVSKENYKDPNYGENYVKYVFSFKWKVQEKYGSASKIKNEFGPSTETIIGLRFNFLSNSNNPKSIDTGNITCTIDDAKALLPFILEY